ncbi:MAG: thiopurine S-methyltransferase [Candidatus Thiodiazotropha sp. (ex Gloverina cf. vestifex)]|nr:thiopurine S-methyltransferase [Candidatus Thiodiazotropha sp. (ex Gloverina cf. vestifex)]
MAETDNLREPNINWMQRWQEQNIGWHHVEFNPHLLNFWHTLHLPQGSLVLAPLCGKSRDMVWLAEQGYRIRGVELSPLAVESFFKELNLNPEVESVDGFDRWCDGPFEIFCGDIFDLALLDNSTIDAVYDRASLIALNPQQRQHYVSLLKEHLPGQAKILLVAMDYPQDEMQGPPFSVAEPEVRELFEPEFSVKLQHTLNLLDDTDRYGDKGVSRMVEQVYLLKP